MKTIELHLYIHFNDDIETDEDINTVGENVRKALVNQYDIEGLAPKHTFTKGFSVISPCSNVEIHEGFNKLYGSI